MVYHGKALPLAYTYIDIYMCAYVYIYIYICIYNISTVCVYVYMYIYVQKSRRVLQELLRLGFHGVGRQVLQP